MPAEPRQAKPDQATPCHACRATPRRAETRLAMSRLPRLSDDFDVSCFVDGVSAELAALLGPPFADADAQSARIDQRQH